MDMEMRFIIDLGALCDVAFPYTSVPLQIKAEWFSHSIQRKGKKSKLYIWNLESLTC